MYIYFLSVYHLSLLEVGLLISIREAIIYIFEIPSGVIADRYGKKLELVVCFLFYISSFVIFFIGGAFYVFIIAMVLFGLGEAFRSGTHKAMIMQYLDHNEIGSSKTKIYGSTRAMSQLGSMAMSLIAIALIIIFKDLSLDYLRYLFLLSILPYLIDLLLIVSYPNYLNQRQSSTFNLKEFLYESYQSIKYVFKSKPVRRLLIEASSYQAGFKSIKDYVQPIILAIPVGYVLLAGYTDDQNSTIYLGIIYAIIYLISSFSSKNAHKVVAKTDSRTVINMTWLFSAIIMFVIAFFLHNIFVVFGVFILFYVLLNIRRPLMVELVGNASDPGKRASVLSVESQMTSLLVVVFAPLLGFIADQSMKWMFILISVIMVGFFVYNMFFTKHKFQTKAEKQE
ncbi:MAG: MFS transporter [Bacilli bacterium]|nr:MFS transporter [Bacilli bacterium]